MKNDLIIVGIDVGTTTAVAIIDTKGNLIELKSKRNFKKNEILRFVSSHGKCIVIGTDVNPAPKIIESISRNLGCYLFVPRKSMKKYEKSKLTRNFKKKISNVHELDALAAAIKAYKKFRKFFTKIFSNLKRIGMEEYYNQVAQKMIQKKAGSIKQALEISIVERRMGEALKKSNKKFENEIKKLLKTIKEKDSLIKKLEGELKSIHERKKKEVNAEIRLLKLRILHLEKIIEKLKLFEELIENGLEPVIEVDDLSISELRKIDKEIGLKNKVVLLKSNKNLTNLNEFGIKCAIIRFESDKLVDFPLIKEEYIKFEEIRGIKAVRRELIEKLLSKTFKHRLEEWLENYRKRKI